MRVSRVGKRIIEECGRSEGSCSRKGMMRCGLSRSREEPWSGMILLETPYQTGKERADRGLSDQSHLPPWTLFLPVRNNVETTWTSFLFELRYTKVVRYSHIPRILRSELLQQSDDIVCFLFVAVRLARDITNSSRGQSIFTT